MCSTRSSAGLLPTMTGAASGPIDEGRVVEPESMPGEGASSTPRMKQKSKYAAINQLSCVACHPCPLSPDPESARPQTYYLAGSAVPARTWDARVLSVVSAREINRPPGDYTRAPNRVCARFSLKYAQRQLGISRCETSGREPGRLRTHSANPRCGSAVCGGCAPSPPSLFWLVIWLGYSVVTELVAARAGPIPAAGRGKRGSELACSDGHPRKAGQAGQPVPASRAAVPLDGVPAPADAVPEAVPDTSSPGPPWWSRRQASSRTGEAHVPFQRAALQRWRSRIFAPRARGLRRRHGLLRWRRVRRRQRGSSLTPSTIPGRAMPGWAPWAGARRRKSLAATTPARTAPTVNGATFER